MFSNLGAKVHISIYFFRPNKGVIMDGNEKPGVPGADQAKGFI
jgi:hypothetical protein